MNSRLKKKLFCNNIKKKRDINLKKYFCISKKNSTFVAQKKIFVQPKIKFLRRTQTIAKQFIPRPKRGAERIMPNRINEKIKGLANVRLVGDNVEQGIYTYEDALKLADDMELDLVEISPNVDPPVCKIVDYQKFLYQQKKREKEQKINATKIVVKEIRFGPQTDDHDFNFKLKHAQEFLKEGNKVKAYVFFKGRSILFKEQGEEVLLRFATALEDLAKVDSMPRLEGKRMIIFLSPKKKS